MDLSRHARALLGALLVAAAPAAQPFQTDAAPVAGTLAPAADATAALDLTLRGTTESERMECPGVFEPAAPDAVVTWGGNGPLRLTVRSATDATLAVVDPQGRWHCNDDAEGLMPVVEITGAAAGRYAVWVGTFYSPGGAATLVAGAPSAATVLALDAEPRATLALAAGFGASEPMTVDAGGIDAVPPDLAMMCSGFVDASRPTARLRYTADAPARLSIRLDSEATDPVLVVRTPDGSWLCNDDASGLNAGLSLDEAAAGDYLVWAGAFRSRARAETTDAVLWFDEQEIVDDFAFGFDEPMRMAYSTGTYRPLDLTTAPAVRLDLRGDTPASADVAVQPNSFNPVVGDACRGAIEAAATALVTLSGDGPVAITASGERDLVLLLQTPGGDWLCSDDADGLDPGIQIDDVESGTYRVWVGAFADPDGGETFAATLTIARGEVEVTFPDYGFDDGSFGMGEPFAEGTYDGDALALGQPRWPVALAADVDGAEIEVDAEGTLLNPVAGPTCAGFVGARATASVDLDGTGTIAAHPMQGDDLVMVVRTPDGRWFCSDDADGSSDPLVQMAGGTAGTYEIWVGTFSRRPSAPAVLSVSR